MNEIDDTADLGNLQLGDIDLENVVETEGLRYFGGFIVHKFPQYQFLGCKVEEGDGTWTEVAS